MERIKLHRALFCWLLVLAVLFVGGCAGPRPKETEKKATVERPDKQKVSPVSGGQGEKVFIPTSSGKEKGDINQQGTDTTRPIPLQVPAVLPTPESGAVKAKPAPKPEPTPPVLNPAEKPREKKVAEDRGPKIVLNFDNADLYAVISTIGELLGINYIIGLNVAGKVTINTAGGLYKKDLFPIFLKILEVNGLTAIKEGNLYRIVEIKDSPRMPIDLLLKMGGESVPPMDKVVIQIIPLKFISTGDMATLITPFMSKGGTIVSDVNSNTLIVIDKWLNILNALRLIETFDVNMFDKVKYRFYPIKHLDAEEIVAFFTDFTSYYEKATNVFVKFIALTRMNTLLVITTAPDVFEKVEEILHRVDVSAEGSQPKIHIYFVKNGKAKGLASLLGKVFKTKSSSEDKTGKAGGSATIAGNPLSAARVKEKKAEKAKETKARETSKKVSAVTKGEGEGSGTLMGEISITSDEIRNALIIEAIPSDYRLIEDILRRIDVLPRQVLIEATIAEVTHESGTELGVDWAFGKGAAGQGTGSFLATIGKAGLKYSIGVTDKWYAELNALATKGLVNVISSPHVLASDNQEAKIDVSREIPVSSGYTDVSSGATISTTSIEYRDTGVILAVTPHINARGLVTMDISQEVSDQDKDVGIAGLNYPSFFKRTVKTTLTVKHGQTIVIGGLIKDKETENISGVPCLIDVPVARYLFGQETKKTEKVELIILITPRVVADLDDVDAVTQEFKQKTRNVVKRFFPQ